MRRRRVDGLGPGPLRWTAICWQPSISRRGRYRADPPRTIVPRTRPKRKRKRKKKTAGRPARTNDSTHSHGSRQSINEPPVEYWSSKRMPEPVVPLKKNQNAKRPCVLSNEIPTADCNTNDESIATHHLLLLVAALLALHLGGGLLLHHHLGHGCLSCLCLCLSLLHLR